MRRNQSNIIIDPPVPQKTNYWPALFIGILIGIVLTVLILGFMNSSQGKKFLFTSPKPTAVFEETSPKPKKKIKKTISFEELKIPIIMYHYVEYVKDQGDTIRKSLNISPFTFEEQLKALQQNNYQTFFVRDVPKLFSKKTKYSTQSALLTFDDGYEDFYTVVYPLLKKYQTKATLFVIYSFIGRNDFVNKEQINEMINSGLVEIGAHTLNHVYLKGMGKNKAEEEILQSKKNLEDDFAIKVESFAYPFGAYDDQIVKIVKEASFSAAVTVNPGTIQQKSNIFTLKRIRSGVVASPNIINVLENFNR